MQLPVLVQNNEDGPLVFDDLATPYLRWEGKGDPDGGDVQVVPEAMFGNPNFVRVVARGSLEVLNPEDNPALSDVLERMMGRDQLVAQRAAAERRKSGQAKIGEESIEHTENKDVLGEECVGPDARGGKGKCGALVNLTATKKKDTPPLCAKHKKLASEFVPQVDVSGDKQSTKWVRVTMGRREKEIEG